MRKPLVFALAAASLGAIGLAGPASACLTTDTNCTTTVVAVPVTNGGTLSILATPLATGTNALSLGTTTTSSAGLPVVSGALMPTTVTDTRLSSVGWSVAASVGTFAPGTGVTGSIPVSAAAFSVTSATAAPGLGQPTFAYSATPVASGNTILTASVPSGSTLGPNTVTYTPTIHVTIPAGTALSTYTGTVTQSVS